MGCDLAQGYYLSRPLDGTRFMSWLGAYEKTLAAGPPLPVPDPIARRRLGPAAAAHRGGRVRAA